MFDDDFNNLDEAMRVFLWTVFVASAILISFIWYGVFF